MPDTPLTFRRNLGPNQRLRPALVECRRSFIGWTGSAVAVSAGGALLISRFGDAAVSDTAASAIPISLRVNGIEHTLDLDPRTTLRS